MENKFIKKTIIITFLSLVLVFDISNSASAQTTYLELINQVKTNTETINYIQTKISDLKENYRLLYDGSVNQNNQLGNQITYSGYILGAFSLIFLILGIFLAWYINRQYEKIRKMKNIVEDTKQYIKGHTKSLYKQIKRDETVELLNRLKEVPEDVANICPLLFARDLLADDYFSLKESYIKIRDDGYHADKKEEYIALFLQHFPYEILKDSDLKMEVIDYINANQFSNMWTRDIKNYFRQIFRYLKEFGVDDEQNKVIVKNSFFNYFISKFKVNTELGDYINALFIEFQLDKKKIISIAQEGRSSNESYIGWLNSKF